MSKTDAHLLQKKVCMIGSFAVGKTSLVSRFVHNTFSEKYLSTVGVKIDRKEVQLDEVSVNIMLWDLHGDDAFQRVRMNYVRGSHGYILVVDGTRRATLETALQLHQQIKEAHGELPFVLSLNKADLKSEWEITDREIDQLAAEGWAILETSAKDDAGVEHLFSSLSNAMLERSL